MVSIKKNFVMVSINLNLNLDILKNQLVHYSTWQIKALNVLDTYTIHTYLIWNFSKKLI